MHLVTSDEMIKLDRHTIDTFGIPVMALMENAGKATAEEAIAVAAYAGIRWLIMAGKGNNGGDGLVAARHMIDAGLDVTVVFAADPAGFTGEAAIQRDIAAKLGIRCLFIGADEIRWADFDGIVDALLGTGTRGAPREQTAAFIRQANDSGKPIVALDIPSGLNADTGEVYEPCIRAAVTVALAFKKRGLAQFPGAACAGRVVVRAIGIPAKLADAHGIRTFELSENVFAERLGVRPDAERAADAHKGTYGHVLVAAGSRAMSGAGLLCATAALRGGCGLVSWALPESAAPALIGRQPELMLAAVPDGGRGDFSAAEPEALLALARGKAAVVVGPGLGRWDGDDRWLRAVWEQCDAPLVLDADALNMLAAAADFGLWPKRRAATVLTPHPAEMARLAGCATADVQRDRIALARSYALRHGVTLVLKGARTVCATPAGDVYVNVTGNAGMATAGAGDVLAGLIASLLAQGMDAAQAAALGVYRHGAAGDRAAAKRHSPGSLIAGDIIAEL